MLKTVKGRVKRMLVQKRIKRRLKFEKMGLVLKSSRAGREHWITRAESRTTLRSKARINNR